MHCAGIRSYVIEFRVPNNGKDDANDQEEKSRPKNTATILFLALTELTRTVIGIALVLCSAHGDKGENHVPENESNTYECTLAADVHQSRKQRHQYAGDEESVRENLDIYRQAVRKKSF